MWIRIGRFLKMFRVGRPITSRVTTMMTSGFASTPLRPVGYEAIELHRLLIDFRVQVITLGIWLLCRLLNHRKGCPCWRYRFVSDLPPNGDTLAGVKSG